jgi:hypothetical protein
VGSRHLQNQIGVMWDSHKPADLRRSTSIV